MTGPLVVTGGTGLLGMAIREAAPEAVFLSSADGDLRDSRVSHRLFSDLRPSAVLHLAGRVGGIKANAADNPGFFEDNALLNTAVLSAARHARVPKLVAFLSSCAFPLFPDRPTTERDLHLSTPYEGNGGYGYAKRMLDVHLHMVASEEGLAWSSLTPVTMYGPHDAFENDSGHVVSALIRRCWDAKAHDTPFIVWGRGQAIRQFVFVRDVARIALRAIEEPLDPATTIVAADEGVTIKSLAGSIASAMDYRGPIVFDSSQPEGVHVKRLRSAHFSSAFPDFRFTPLQAGLHDTVEWFLNHRQPAAEAKRRAPSLCPQT